MPDCRVELHMHTAEVSPCGLVRAKKGVRIYHKLGYQAIVITDHFNKTFFGMLWFLSWRRKVDLFLRGYRRAKSEGDRLGIKVLLGMEFCAPDSRDDILVYGFDESFLYERENLHLLTPQGLYEEAKKADLLLIQAHPFRKKISQVYDSIIEGIEVFNGNPRHNSHNDKALSHAMEKGHMMTSGSDFHQKNDAGTGGVYLPRVPKNSRDLVNMLREIRTPKLIHND